MRLIINADDLGYNRERDRGIFECFLDSKSVTSTSILANGMYAAEAVQQALRVNIPMGLHFNITEGKPLSDAKSLPTLVSGGLFLGKEEFVNAVKRGSISEREVELELSAQIEWFKKVTHSIPFHVDGHQHVHAMPYVREKFCEILNDYGIQYTRLGLTDEECVPEHAEFLEYVIKCFRDCGITFASHRIKHTQKFIGLGTMGAYMTLERLQRALGPFIESDVTCELMVHPGYCCVGDGGCGAGPDDFSKSQEREHEMGVLRGKDFKEFIRNHDITLISYHDLS